MYDGCNGLPHFSAVYDKLKMNGLSIDDFINPTNVNYLSLANELATAICKSGIENWF